MLRIHSEAEKRKLINSRSLPDDIKVIGQELLDKPLGIVGATLVDVAEVIKKKYQNVYRNIIKISSNISKGLVESKNATMKNVKKPLKDVMRAEGADVSMDKELTASIENPLFQADNKDSSHNSNPAIKLEGSEKSGSGAKRLNENAFMFGGEGYFLEQMDNFTTEQNEFFQRNLFTQEMDQLAQKRKLLDGLTFEEIQEKLNQELQERAAKPKKEKTYVTVDELVTKTTAETDDSIQQGSEFSLANFSPEFHLERRIESDIGLTELAKLDWEEIFSNLPRELREQPRRSEALQVPDDQFGGGFPSALDGGFNQNDFALPDIRGFNFDENGLQNGAQGIFIGEEQPGLTFSYDEDQGQRGFASKIIAMVKEPPGGKKKKGAAPEKVTFSDVVTKFKVERDVADLFFDLMCAARTGDVVLNQKMSAIDKKTHLPMIEISVAGS